MSDTQDWNLALAEKECILKCMAYNANATRKEIAALLGISIPVLNNKLKAHGIAIPAHWKAGRPKVKVEATPLVQREDLSEVLETASTNFHNEGTVSVTAVPVFTTAIKDEGEE